LFPGLDETHRQFIDGPKECHCRGCLVPAWGSQSLDLRPHYCGVSPAEKPMPNAEEEVAANVILTTVAS